MLDVVCVSNDNLICNCYVGESFLDQPLRYHCPIYCCFNIQKSVQQVSKRNIWLFDRGNYDLLREKLSVVNWNILDLDDINVAVKIFTDTLLATAQSCIPYKEIIVRSNEPPWLSNEIKRLIRKRKRAHKKAKRSSTNTH